MNNKIKILFLCTGNSCRSQMAEGLCRHFKGDSIEPFSAGIKKHCLNPLAVKVMDEIGIDISGHYSKTLAELGTQQFDYLVTLCGQAHESCPFFPALKKVIHRGFDDPPKLSETAATEEEALEHYRRVRDEIKHFILSLPSAIDVVCS